MGTARSLAKNSFWLTAGTGATILIGAVYRPIIGRMLGPVDYGRYTFITTFVGYFTILAYFGVRWIVVREIGKDRTAARAYLRVGLKIRTVTAIFAILVCCTVGLFLNLDHRVKTGIMIYSLTLAIGGAGELLEGVLLACERSYYIAIANLTGCLLKLGIGLWALKAGYGLLGVLVVFTLTTVVSTTLDWWFTRSLLEKEKQRDAEPGFTMSMFRESLLFVVYAFAARLYQKNDVLFLTMLRGPRTTGIYAAAYAFLDLLMTVNNSVVTAAYPLLSRMHAQSTNSLGSAYERLHKYMLLGLFPISILLMSHGRIALWLIFGKAFLRGTPSLQVLVWTLPVEVSCLVSGTFLCAMSRQSVAAKITAYSAVVNVTATVGLILLYDAVGAAVATVGASTFSAIVHYVYVKRSIEVKTINAWLKPAVCCLLMLLAILAVPGSMPVLGVFVGLAVYVGAIALIRPLDAEDRRLFMSLIQRRAKAVAGNET